MIVAVLGASGLLGAPLAARLAADGHDVRALHRSSPSHPVDLTTGDGLGAALEGAEVVVDCANGPPTGAAAAVLAEGTRRLLEAGAAAGVRHHVCVSIVGCDRVPMAYYRVKAEQERIVQAGPLPWTVVRATQVHDLLEQWFGLGAARRVAPRSRALLQPVDAEEVAAVLAGVVAGAPRRATVDVAGPEARRATDLAKAWRTARGVRGVPVPLLLPGRLGTALRAGALCAREADVVGRRTFEDWLAATPRP